MEAFSEMYNDLKSYQAKLLQEKSEVEIAKRMLDKGNEYVIVWSKTSKQPDPLYVKSQKMAIETIRDDFPDEKGYKIMKTSAFIKGLKESVDFFEAVDEKKIIKELIDTGWSGSNEEQMKAVQLLKGLATSDSPEANKFMKALDKFTSSLNAEDF